MTDQRNDNYIGIDEVSDYLGVKASTVRTWIKNKGMPAHKIGGKLWKFKRSEIDLWVESQRNSEEAITE